MGLFIEDNSFGPNLIFFQQKNCKWGSQFCFTCLCTILKPFLSSFHWGISKYPTFTPTQTNFPTKKPTENPSVREIINIVTILPAAAVEEENNGEIETINSEEKSSLFSIFDEDFLIYIVVLIVFICAAICLCGFIYRQQFQKKLKKEREELMEMTQKRGPEKKVFEKNIDTPKNEVTSTKFFFLLNIFWLLNHKNWKFLVLTTGSKVLVVDTDVSGLNTFFFLG